MRPIILAALMVLVAAPVWADTQGAIDELRREQRVKEVFYKEGKPVEWVLGVFTDGGPQFGYAMYACNLLHQQKVVHKNTWIMVVDIVKVKNGTSFKDASLGRANCHTWETKYR